MAAVRSTSRRGRILWPRVTPDGRQALFVSPLGGFRLWSVPLEGGPPAKIADIDARVPDVSPDGKSVAFLSFVGVEKPTVGICDLPACSSQRRLPTPGLKAPAQSSGIRWTPDGRGIAYLNVEPQPNIWIQPLDGSPPQQLTHFTDGRQIPDFAWSHDGTRLAVVRAETSTDIVLYRGLRR